LTEREPRETIWSTCEPALGKVAKGQVVKQFLALTAPDGPGELTIDSRVTFYQG
jgi:hypothetical protein